MGDLMRRRGLLPDVILSSPAKRARKTAVLVKQGGSLDADIVFDEQIYEASPIIFVRLSPRSAANIRQLCSSATTPAPKALSATSPAA